MAMTETTAHSAPHTSETEMSNTEALDAMYRAFNAGDLEGTLEYWHTDCEWRPAFGPRLLGANAYFGHEGFRKYWHEVGETLDGYRVVPAGYDEFGDEVICRNTTAGRGRSSRVEVTQRFAIHYTMRDGKIARGQTYADLGEAMSAVSATLAEKAEPSASTEAAGDQPRRVGQVTASFLVVDDHAGFRAQARAVLEAAGYKVVGEAEDAAGAVTQARALHPDAILLDVQLPDGDGFSVAAELGGDPDPPRIVLISSREASDYGSRLDGNGMVGFIHKPDLSRARLVELVGAPE
jgi:CheY-like chemotaxis protein/ketosteroid isomerase-like protein